MLLTQQADVERDLSPHDHVPHLLRQSVHAVKQLLAYLSRMQISPIECLALNLATAAACEHAKRLAATEIGTIVGRHDVSDIPGWSRAAHQRAPEKFDAIRGRRAWDIVMAVSALVTRLGGRERMSEDRMSMHEKELAKAGQRDDAISAIVARRKIRRDDAIEIVDRWVP